MTEIRAQKCLWSRASRGANFDEKAVARLQKLYYQYFYVIMLVMSSSEISDITKTINQFRTVYENSGLKEMQDSFKQISESIHCSLKPNIDFSETWNKKQEEIKGKI